MTMVKVGDHILTLVHPVVRPLFLVHHGPPAHVRPGHPTARRLARTARPVSEGDQDIYQMNLLGTFSERAVVPQISLIPIRKDAPLEVVCLVSCGVIDRGGRGDEQGED